MIKHALDLSDFNIFIRNNIREIIFFSCTNIVANADKNKILVLDIDQMSGARCIVFYHNYQWYCIIITEHCNSRIINDIHNTAITNWDILLDKYKTVPEDKIDKITKDLEQTKEIIYETIEKLRERGTNLEELSQKTDKLSKISKTFLIDTKKRNRCCIIM